MDVARSTITGEVYTALDFEALGATKIGELRYDLVCTACGGPGYFRKSSSAGHGPCFGAHPHNPNCELAATTDDPWGEAGDDAVQKMEADQTRILLSLGQRREGQGDGLEGSAVGARAGRRFALIDAPHRSQMQRNPDKLLRMLVESERFRTSGLLISTGIEDVAVHDFFVAFGNASRQQHLGQYRGFWGKPHSIRDWQGLTYLNTGRIRPTLSFWLPKTTIDAVCERYRLGAISELADRNVLIIGRPELSTTDKFYMNVMDPRTIGVM